MNKSIKTYPMEELQAVVSAAGQPKFRSKQLYDWLHKHHAQSYDDMTNLPKSFRSFLEENYPLSSPEVADRQVSTDGTRKYIVKFPDGALVETVAMPSLDGSRLSVCVSSQVGCPMGCLFCATGKEGFSRNLESFEITDQLAIVQSDFQRSITNVVIMGQGEPFLNYPNVIAALCEMNNEDSFNIGARHITVSTCGIIEGIDKFSTEPYQFTLAISLHSAIQEDRDLVMPRVANQGLTELKQSLHRYIDKTNRRVTFEYLLINGVNDTENHLKALCEYTAGILCHVNLLAMNEIDGSPFAPSKAKTINHWIETLNRQGTETTLRNSRGSDIAGACGQLKNQFSK